MHSKNVCHRDIKPQNIILDIGYDCSLIDFGVSKGLSKQDFEKMTSGVKGTYHYLSPELMRKKIRDSSYIDLFACDMWALGVVLYIMAYYKLPFDTSSKKAFKSHFTDPNFEVKYLGSKFDDIIRGLLERDATK